MPIGTLVVLLVIVIIFIVIYKRQMIIQMFSINIASMANEFRTQMQDTADNAVKKLEQQMTQLEYMLEEADAKILVLEDLLQQAEHRSLSHIPVTIAESPLSISDSSEHIQPFDPDASAGKTHTISASLVQSVQNLQQENVQDKRKQVVAMHQQGYSVVEIAKATSMGKGEVMLILELNKNF